MGSRGYLSSLLPWNKARDIVSEAPPPGNRFGMHLLYDGTEPREARSLVEEEEDNQPCLEPVE